MGLNKNFKASDGWTEKSEWSSQRDSSVTENNHWFLRVKYFFKRDSNDLWLQPDISL